MIKSEDQTSDARIRIRMRDRPRRHGADTTTQKAGENLKTRDPRNSALSAREIRTKNDLWRMSLPISVWSVSSPTV